MDFQTALGCYLTPEQLASIGGLAVGIAGAGGLGSNCAAHLVRSGFRNLHLVDFDCVEPSNLNRQFFFADQIGRPKVAALAENLRRITPDLSLALAQARITEDNAADWFADCDVVVECVDVPAVKAWLIEAYVPAGKLVVAASGIAGCDLRPLPVRQIGKLVLVGDEQSGIDKSPPLAPRVAAAAALQANAVLHFALRQAAQKSGGRPQKN